VSWLFFDSAMLLPYQFKRSLLRAFGARIGRGVIVKPHVRIKYPWNLTVGDHAWIGEEVWIDNLGAVRIGAHACLSQGCLILSGNHNFKRRTFDLMVGEIRIGNGAWIGAKAVVTSGVTVGDHAVLTVASVASKDLEADGIYRGNPAEWEKKREWET
jgi:putative colanic acid biosynthesis acetyltransferase WcaF